MGWEGLVRWKAKSKDAILQCVMRRRKEIKSLPLNDEKIREHLCTSDLKVIDVIYKTCTKTLYHEEERTKAIDSKGASTLAMIGVSLSLVFSLGGLLIEKITNQPLLFIESPILWLVLFYSSASATLFISAIYTLCSIRTRSDWRWLKDSDIFHQQMIEDGECVYKRYIITHVWKIYQNNFRVNEKKGSLLRIGQILYIGALFQLLPIIAMIALYSMKKGGIIL